jgi:uncharacterized Zn finger protein/DNA-binding XRE family transcriptional regulator
MSYWRWAPYVPVAERRAKARKQMEKLRKKGKNIQPVEIEGRIIARSFWGKGWCKHLESFSDYANRLPRGRTYVRNGSVCHLEISKGEIRGMVSGTSMYTVKIAIDELSTEKWKEIKEQCTGRVGSILELLKGKLSEEVMAVVSDRKNGLFPLPKEIELNCSCPDWATMCKHVAAVLYGVGHRLDTEPDLLFTLRGVDAQELIIAPISIADETGDAQADTLEDAVLADVFGINMDQDVSDMPSAADKNRKNKKKQKVKSGKAKSVRVNAKAVTSTKEPAKSKPPKTAKQTVAAKPKAKTRSKPAKPFNPNGTNIKNLRINSGLSVAEFARRIDANTNTVYRWERTKGKCNIQSRLLAALEDIHKKQQRK